MDVLVDMVDPADRNHVVFEAAGEVQLGQFDQVADDVIDPADMFAVGTDDFVVFADLRGVYHGNLLRLVRSGKPPDRGSGCITEVVMGEVVNLNRVRKDRAKAEAKTVAVANRAAHGRSKADKTKAEKERARAERLLDGSKLED